MQYNVSQLLQDSTGATRHYAVDEPANVVQELLDEDATTVKTLLKGEVRLLRTTDGILVTGRLETSVLLPCDRCLSEFPIPVTLELEENFRPTIDIRSGASLPRVSGEETATLIDERHILDLAEVVRQRILLSVPMHPVCRTECAGLCPQCGHELNNGLCSCESEVKDPRWLKLQVLLDELAPANSQQSNLN